MPENAYVKEVALDGKTAADRVLDFSQGVGGSRLKIVVSRAGAQISGRLLGKDGEPALGPVMVYMGTDAGHIDQENAAQVRDGKYSFKAVRPGKYRIFAVDIVASMAAFMGDEGNAMKKLFDAAEEIEVKDGDRISIDLTAVAGAQDKKEGK